MRTTLDLPDPLFREVKSRAAREGMKLKDLIAQYIEAGLRPTNDKRGHTEPLQVAIPQEMGKAPGKALSNRELHALLDEEDVKTYKQALTVDGCDIT